MLVCAMERGGGIRGGRWVVCKRWARVKPLLDPDVRNFSNFSSRQGGLLEQTGAGLQIEWCSRHWRGSGYQWVGPVGLSTATFQLSSNHPFQGFNSGDSTRSWLGHQQEARYLR